MLREAYGHDRQHDNAMSERSRHFRPEDTVPTRHWKEHPLNLHGPHNIMRLERLQPKLNPVMDDRSTLVSYRPLLLTCITNLFFRPKSQSCVWLARMPFASYFRHPRDFQSHSSMRMSNPRSMP